MRLGVVPHAYDLSYSGGGSGRLKSRLAPGKNKTPYWKKIAEAKRGLGT
jgi:hypothetical protein